MQRKERGWGNGTFPYLYGMFLFVVSFNIHLCLKIKYISFFHVTPYSVQGYTRKEP